MSRLLFSPDYEQEIAWELERWCRLVIVTLDEEIIENSGIHQRTLDTSHPPQFALQ